MGLLRAIDLFCGAGGSSWGARQAGVDIVAGFDLWPVAESVYRDNFPEAIFFGGRLQDYDPYRLASQLGHIDIIIASPECTGHSLARGKRPPCDRSRDTALEVVRFARALEPRWIVVENVVSMRSWSRYGRFVSKLKALGYYITEETLNAVDFGVPQARRRLFIGCDREKKTMPTRIPSRRTRTAQSVVSMNGNYAFTPLRTERRAGATIQRAERAIATLGKDKPFLLVYYSTDRAGGWQPLDVPLRTVTTLDRFALVKPAPRGHVMRMLQVPELKKAMGMPRRLQVKHGTRRDRIKLIGNAVCPPVMCAKLRALISN